MKRNVEQTVAIIDPEILRKVAQNIKKGGCLSSRKWWMHLLESCSVSSSFQIKPKKNSFFLFFMKHPVC
jgi:hypothetical protein